MPPRPTVQRPTTTAITTPTSPRSDDPWGAAAGGLRVLLYGQSGSGKTTLAGTFPGPILWLVCSGPMNPGELRSIDTPEMRRKVTPRFVRSVDQMKSLLEEARGYSTTVLDHATGLADLVLKEILNLTELPAQKGWGLASQQQYGQQSLQVKECLRTLLSLPGNSIVIAQERTTKPKDDARPNDPGALDLVPTTGPDLSPSTTSWLAPSCDYVVHTFKRTRMVSEAILLGGKPTGQSISRKDGVEYCLRTGPHEYFMTKFRVPRHVRLPDVIVDPDYAKIQAVIDGRFGG